MAHKLFYVHACSIRKICRRNITRTDNFYTVPNNLRAEAPKFIQKYKELLPFYIYFGYAELYRCKVNIFSQIG